MKMKKKKQQKQQNQGNQELMKNEAKPERNALK